MGAREESLTAPTPSARSLKAGRWKATPLEVLLFLVVATCAGAYLGILRGELERTKAALEQAHETVFVAHQTVHAQDASIAQAGEENAALAAEVGRLERTVRKNGRAARLMEANNCRADDPLCGIPLHVLDGMP